MSSFFRNITIRYYQGDTRSRQAHLIRTTHLPKSFSMKLSSSSNARALPPCPPPSALQRPEEPQRARMRGPENRRRVRPQDLRLWVEQAAQPRHKVCHKRRHCETEFLQEKKQNLICGVWRGGAPKGCFYFYDYFSFVYLPCSPFANPAEQSAI